MQVSIDSKSKIEKQYLKISFRTWYAELAFIPNQKWENNIYKLGIVDDRISILQLAGSRSKKTSLKLELGSR